MPVFTRYQHGLLSLAQCESSGTIAMFLIVIIGETTWWNGWVEQQGGRDEMGECGGNGRLVYQGLSLGVFKPRQRLSDFAS